MKNTLYDGYLGPRLPKEVQLKRIKQVMEQELTEKQRATILAYYVHRQTIPQIAATRGVHKSTVSRTLKRAERNLRRFLKY